MKDARNAWTEGQSEDIARPNSEQLLGNEKNRRIRFPSDQTGKTESSMAIVDGLSKEPSLPDHTADAARAKIDVEESTAETRIMAKTDRSK